MSFANLVDQLGTPVPVASPPIRPNLPDELRKAVEEKLTGRYADGLLSFWGERERLESLGGWEVWLPAGSFIFASTAFGLSLVWGADHIWLLDPQYGQVVESGLTVEEALESLTKERWLRRHLFEDWKKHAQAFAAADVLATVPLLALGGSWDANTLHPEPFEVFLGITAGLHSPESSMPAEVRLLED